MAPSKKLMRHALDIGISPKFYVTIDRLDLRVINSDLTTNLEYGNNSVLLPSKKIHDDSKNDETILPDILVTTSFLIKEGLNENEFVQISEKIRKSVSYSLKEICKPIPKVNYTGLFSYTYLDPDVENCFKCENCGRWASNQEKPNEISGLPDGREFEGMLVCDQCECWKHDPDFGWTNKNE
jgi:hypothetical protein